jgi:hypothetical protein
LDAAGAAAGVHPTDRKLLDEATVVAVDWTANNRKLSDESAMDAVQWTTALRKLYDQDGDTVLDFILRILYDENVVKAVEFTVADRKLYDSAGSISQDFGARVLTDSSQVPAFDYSVRQLIDENAALAIEWVSSSRKLYATDGSTSMDFGNRTLNDYNGNSSVDYTGRTAYDENGNEAFRYYSTGRQLRDQNSAVVMDFTTTRSLYDVAGTPVLDFETRNLATGWTIESHRFGRIDPFNGGDGVYNADTHGKTYSNEDATGTCEYNLPAPGSNPGVDLVFVCTKALTLKVNANSGENIYIGSLSTTSFISTSTIGATVTLRCVASKWFAIAGGGDWTPN